MSFHRFGQGLTEVPLHSSEPSPTPPTKTSDILNISIRSIHSYRRIEDEESITEEEEESRSVDSYKMAVEQGDK